jgi:tripartite ATP-independent transporter DctM subunit
MLAATRRVLCLGSEETGGVDDSARPGSGAAGRCVHTALDVIDLLARAILVMVFCGELVLILVEIFRREVFNQSFLWSEEVSQIALLVITFIGGPIAYRAHSHAAVSFATKSLRPAVKDAVEAGIDVTILGISLLAALASLDLISIDSMSVLPTTQWNLAVTVVPFVVGMVLIAIFAIERLMLHHHPRAALRGALGVGALTLLVLSVWWVPALQPGNGLSLLLMLAAFLAVILLGLPVAFALLVGTILYVTLTNVAPMVAVPQTTINGAGLFVLLTIPFFIWAGLIMERGGISIRLVRFAMTLVGHFRGGLLQVVIVTTFLVAGVSGSKLADVMAVGSIMREQLTRNGYRKQDGAGVLAAATAMSESIPPSISMLVLGSVVPVSIGQMFVAGLLPAALLAAILMALVWFIAFRHSAVRLAKASGRDRARAAFGAILPIAMPAILIIGIKGGFATPTEVSSVAVFYGILLAVLVYRQMDWRNFIGIIIESAVMSGMVLFMIAAAGSFAWAMANGNMPQYLLHFLSVAGDNKYAFLAGTIVIVIVVGSLLEGLPALLILAPILYPVAVRLGVDGVQYAIVLVLAMGVGIFVPPTGIGFFASCSVMRASVEDTSRAAWPYMLALLLGIFVVAYVPWFSTVVLDFVGR